MADAQTQAPDNLDTTGDSQSFTDAFSQATGDVVTLFGGFSNLVKGFNSPTQASSPGPTGTPSPTPTAPLVKPLSWANLPKWARYSLIGGGVILFLGVVKLIFFPRK